MSDLVSHASGISADVVKKVEAGLNRALALSEGPACSKVQLSIGLDFVGAGSLGGVNNVTKQPLKQRNAGFRIHKFSALGVRLRIPR